MICTKKSCGKSVIRSQMVRFPFEQTAKAGLKIGCINGQFSGVGLLPNMYSMAIMIAPCLAYQGQTQRKG